MKPTVERRAGSRVEALRPATDAGGAAWSVGSAIRGAAAGLSLGAAAIHASVIGRHFRELWLYGAFFVVATALQLLWGMLVLLRPSRRVVVLGAIGSGALVVLWLVSRTAGLPVGPEGGDREAVGLLDSLATAFEAGIMVAVATLVRTRAAHVPLSRAAALLSGGAAWLLVGGVTASALLLAPADSTEPKRTVSGTVVRPHLVHLVLFLLALAAVAIYSVVDSRNVRKAPRVVQGAGPAANPASRRSSEALP
jgi:hypothetical protein